MPITIPTSPEPREYARHVSLRRRGTNDLNRDSLQLDLPDIERWLLKEAAAETDLLVLFQTFVWKLVYAGLPLHRASLHVGTLHPQFFGYAWNWEKADGFCDEVKIAEASLHTDAYRRNPLFRAIEYGELFRANIPQLEETERSSLLQTLYSKGFTEYCTIPLTAVGGHHNAASIATQNEKGFTTDEFDSLMHLFTIFALHVQRHIALRISENTLSTYLGQAVSQEVLQGSIKRGSGQSIDAVIWASDLRGFTELADKISDQHLIEVLNLYFDNLAGTVLDEGGEVLKYIGDGLLAVFPFANFRDEAAAAEAGILAAQKALERIAQVNSDATHLPHISGWRPLLTGIALHRGEVFFGNIGTPMRLDFTTIGKAVNATSRIESLCKQLQQSILISESVADLISAPLENLGHYELKGLSEPLKLFTLKTA